jgi:hypothetical protein
LLIFVHKWEEQMAHTSRDRNNNFTLSFYMAII